MVGPCLSSRLASYSGFLSGDQEASALTGSPACATPATGSSNVGTYVTLCTVGTLTANNGNYTFSFETGSLTVSPASLTVTANNVSRAYGAANPVLSGTINGIVNGDALSAACSASATRQSPVGAYPITSCVASGPHVGNYTVKSVTAGTLTVTPAPLTITASSSSIVYGQPIPSIRPTYKGLGNSETAPKGAPLCTNAATAHSGAGTYPTSCSQANDSNYTITYRSGTLTISPAHLTITPKSFSAAYGQHLPVLAWSANFVKGDTSASLRRQPRCSTSAPLDKTGAVAGPTGTYSISCSSAAAANYVIGYAPGRLTVTLAHPRITYAGDTTVRRGNRASLSAYLFVSSSKPVVGRKMVFTLGIGGTAQRCTTAATIHRGFGSCIIAAVKQPTGKALVAVHFNGDPKGPKYDYASAKASTVIAVKK